MKILLLGGTGWLGRHVAAEGVARAHEVVCLARGTEVPDGARLVRADRDQDDALAAVSSEQWDVVVDLATDPGHVRRAVRDVVGPATHYVFVSTISVYAAHDVEGVDEDAARLPALEGDHVENAEQYGPGKVAGEDAARAGVGADRLLIVRPGLIGGPGDPTGRTDYWPWRFAHPAVPGRVLVPDAPELSTSIIDVRDLASWIVRCGEERRAGTIDAMGPRTAFAAHIDAAREAVASEARPVWVAERTLHAQGVGQWMGPRSLPLWIAEPEMRAMSARRLGRAARAGLTSRPLVDTLRDGEEWRRQHGGAGLAGLTDEEERALLATYDGA